MTATIKLDWVYTDNIFSNSKQRKLFYNASLEDQKEFILNVLNDSITNCGNLTFNEVDIKIEL